MRLITKENLPVFVKKSLTDAGLNPSQYRHLALKLLQSGAITSVDAMRAREDVWEMVTVYPASRQATRTSGNQVNVFALASVVVGAMSMPPSAASAVPLLLALLGACTISLSPEQAAFFIAADAVSTAKTIPTASAIADEMAVALKEASYSAASVLMVAKQLQQLGVNLSIGDPPNYVLRHTEWTVFIPGF